MHCNMWDEITYPFLFRNGKVIHPTVYNGCNYLSMMGLKLNHVSKRGPSWISRACSISVIKSDTQRVNTTHFLLKQRITIAMIRLSQDLSFLVMNDPVFNPIYIWNQTLSSLSPVTCWLASRARKTAYYRASHPKIHAAINDITAERTNWLAGFFFLIKAANQLGISLTVSALVLAPNGDKPSSCTLMITKLDAFIGPWRNFVKFLLIR